MKPETYALTTGLIFLVIALLHLAHEHGLHSIGNQYRQLYTALLEGKVYA